MSAIPGDRMTKIVAFAAAVEVGTAIVLLADPALVVALLLGTVADATVRVVGRCFGIALLALAVACWPDRASAANAPRDFWAMLIYNAMIALFLAYLGAVRQMGGVLLWPAVALHAVVALLLVWSWRNEHWTKPSNP